MNRAGRVFNRMTTGQHEHDKSDGELMSAYRAGEVSAFDALYERHAGPVLGYLVGLLGDRGRAEDILQDVLVGFVRRISTSEREMDVRGYLLASCRNRAYNAWRDAARGASARERYELFARAPRAPESAAGYLEDDEMRVMLDRAMGSLNVDERETIWLHLRENLTMKAIAELTGAPPGTVASRYRRALEKLRTELNTGMARRGS
jgi:RNA polymerase sigma-70 factor (ECF subfamily)